MADARGPAVFTIAATQPFADALVAKLLAEHDADRLTLARGLVLVPNNRAGIAIRDAFVRQAEGGLLLPRIVAIGDPDLDEQAGASIEAIDDDPIPPAVEPLTRQLILGRLIQEGRDVSGAEAMRLAADLARVLDQLTIERKSARDLEEIELDGALSEHWTLALERMKVVLKAWPRHLETLGLIDLTERRNRLLARLSQRWQDAPPVGFVVAAGISTSAPAVAELLRTIALMPRGAVVLAGLDPLLDEQDWRELDGDEQLDSHPQFHLRRLLDRMSIARAEVRAWNQVTARPARAAAVSNVFAVPERTKGWSYKATARSLEDVYALELANPAEEAQAIAIAIREAVETPGRTVALVTPDRELAKRVSAALARWGIEADDSAGRPLTATLPGSLLLILAMAAADEFAPASLMALLKHPLVRAAEERQLWLDRARMLDRVLRGPRPASGLEGISNFLAAGDERSRARRARVAPWWREVAALLQPLEAAQDGLADMLATVRDVATALCGADLWSGPEGRAAADLLARLEEQASHGPTVDGIRALPAFLRALTEGVVVRPAFGKHPRVSIWGLIEARLQSADLMILGGLNEGAWPALAAPDPWLAPAIRRELGLPGLEQRIGLAAHDLAAAMGATELILTRARRDARGPTIPSRFWLRIGGLTGGLDEPPTRHDLLAPALDGLRGARPERAKRPRPSPPANLRPSKVAVTEVDRLTADPYAFYANRMLQLRELDALDADPGPAWRGTLIHEVLKDWAQKDNYAEGCLTARMALVLAEAGVHPLIRALWQPRLSEAAEWIETEVASSGAAGREPLAAEQWGEAKVSGIDLGGRADRIDRLPGGALAIVDYKTGAPPSTAQVHQGFAMQLGLIGLIAEQGGFEGVEGTALAFEYWSLDRDQKTRKFGRRTSPVEGRSAAAAPEEFVAFTAAKFAEAARRYLLGDEPFTAKMAPQFAYSGYDQLMRLEEWEGRGG